MDRRKFLKTAGSGIAGSALLPGFLTGDAVAGEAGGMKLPNFHLFSKVLQFLDFAELPDTAAALGFNCLDLTVRPGGHVDPENFERDLPALISAMNDTGLSCEMMVTNIVSTENRRDFDLLALARSLGVKSYRMGGLRYDESIHPAESVEQYGRQMAALAEWNREIGITGMYQNHSGAARFGAAIWDLYLVLKDLDPDYIGCQFDVRHAVTDGGLMWPDSFRLMKPYIRSLAFKDFKWATVDGEWKMVSTAIGQGMIEFGRYFRMLKDAGMDYPVSLHCEYNLGGAEKGRKEPTKPKNEILAAIKQDVDTVKRLWSES
jgi:sugar phosphate isomerase/epimerase